MHHTRLALYSDDDGHSYQNVLTADGVPPQFYTTKRSQRVLELRMVFTVDADAALTQAAA